MVRKTFSLRHRWARIRSVPGVGRDVLACVVAVALGLTALTVILSNQDYVPPWADRLVFSADFAQVPAVNPGQHPEVRIAGVEVGQVSDSEVSDTGKARLTLSLEPGHTIYQNAHLVLRPKNPINEMYIEVDPGGPPSKPVAQDGVIPATQTDRPIQPDEVLSHLDSRARTAVTDLLSVSDVALANAPERLPKGLNATDDAVVKFKPVLDKLQKRRGYVKELVTSLSQISGAVGENDARVAQLLDSTQQALGSLSNRSSDLQATLDELPGTTGQLRNSMNGVQELTGQLNPTLDNVHAAAGRLPSTLQRVSGVVDKLDGTVRAANPVVEKAGPVVNNLRPIVNDVRGALTNVEPITKSLQPVTKIMVPYLNDLQAFTFNTSSVFSVSDENGGLVRGHLAIPLPAGGVIPGAKGGDRFPNPPEAGGRN